MRKSSALSFAVGLVLPCFASVAAFAAPAVSSVGGTLSAGQSVSVAGSGFGTKPQAQPMLFDDFEGGTTGQLIQNINAKIGRWDSGAGSENVSYSTAKPRNGSKSAFHNFTSAYSASLSRNVNFQKLYMDFWIMAETLDAKSRNWKPWRFYGDDDRYQLDYVWLCNGQLMNRVQSNASFSKGDWGGPGYTSGKWMHIQLAYKQSSPNVANGTIRHTIDSQTAGLNTDAVITEISAAEFNQIRIGHYWAHDGVDGCAANSGARIYVDDVYLDTSFARVELGNASTYAASTVREIQVPTSWSDSAVSINFNPGKFAPGTTAYLFVTDANNITSPGIAVTIGGQSVRPNPPTGVQVN